MSKKDDYVIADTVFGYPVQFLKLFRNIGLYTIARDLFFFFDSGQSRDHACQIEAV